MRIFKVYNVMFGKQKHCEMITTIKLMNIISIKLVCACVCVCVYL